MKTKEQTPTKQLIVETRTRIQRITIPANAKVTFAPIQPKAGDGPVLRIYRTANEQIAVFRDVVSFREADMNIEELVTEVEGKIEFVEGNSHRRLTNESKKSQKWVKLTI